MQDLSALTPPLLMCAVVIIAIVAFLRHEINRSRTGKSSPDDKFSAGAAQPGDDLQSHRHDDSDAPRTTSGES
jgi:hypothetical protein